MSETIFYPAIFAGFIMGIAVTLMVNALFFNVNADDDDPTDEAGC